MKKKCAICNREIIDKKQMVTVKTGKWYRRKTTHFHIGCFVSDKIKASRIALDTKS